MPATIALQAVGLTKKYDRLLALDSIDLSIRAGSLVALVGPNGAGKSSLIKSWVGFERPTHGTVKVLGIDPFRDRSKALRLVGYVPQSPTLFRELSVEDHLDMMQAIRGGFDRPYAAQRLAELRIAPKMQAGRLSGGQQAQVYLALALGTRAEVLVLDEPLASLDPLARREFLHVLVEAAKLDGLTALLSSHVVTDIEQACDHLVVLGAGRILLNDSIANAKAGHAVKSSSPMNIHSRDGREPDTIVGSFLGSDGSWVSLSRQNADSHVSKEQLRSRGATLEEVVLGYLASGRSEIPR